MPRILKRSTKGVTQRFALYDGPTPTEGVYRSKITNANVYISGSGNPVLYFVATAEARDGDPRAKYDGYPSHARITLGDHDALKEREQALYLAICGKEDADIKAEKDISADDKQNKILSIGGVNPIGKYVNVRLRNSGDETYPLDVDGIYPIRGEAGSSKASKAADDEEPEEDLEEENDSYTEEDLSSMSLAALRKILVDEFDVPEASAKEFKKKTDLIEEIEILSLQNEDEDEDEDEDDEELDEEELDEDEDEDEDEDDEEDREAEIREELAGLDRAALKKRVKKLNENFRITTKTDDDAIRDEIVRIELESPPF